MSHTIKDLRASGVLLSVELEWTTFHRFCSHVSASLPSKPLLANAPPGFFLAAESDPLALLALALRSAPDMAAAAMADDVDCIVDIVIVYRNDVETGRREMHVEDAKGEKKTKARWPVSYHNPVGPAPFPF